MWLWGRLSTESWEVSNFESKLWSFDNHDIAGSHLNCDSEPPLMEDSHMRSVPGEWGWSGNSSLGRQEAGGPAGLQPHFKKQCVCDRTQQARCNYTLTKYLLSTYFVPGPELRALTYGIPLNSHHPAPTLDKQTIQADSTHLSLIPNLIVSLQRGLSTSALVAF